MYIVETDMFIRKASSYKIKKLVDKEVRVL